MKLVVSCLAFVSLMLLHTAAWPQEAGDLWPSYGILGLDDHKAYFREGTYSYYSPDYDMRGQSTYSSIAYSERSGERIRSSEYAAIDVYENILPSRPQAYSKEVYENRGHAIWEPAKKVFISELSNEDFDNGPSGEVWLSDSDFASVTKDDVRFGTISKYYDAAFDETDGACCLTDEQHRSISVGKTAEQCFFIEHKTYEVKCNFRHLRSGFLRSVYYVRMKEAIG